MKIAVIIGGGPAGLSAAYELSKKSDIKPIIFEIDGQVGGLSKTVLYKGNRLDIGPHRFFSKNERVNNLWQEVLPLADRAITSEKIFLKINRLTRILFLNKFFNYPVDLSFNTLKNLGFWRVFKIGFSYFKIKLWPIKPEKSLADFFTNHFGRELYLTFFKDYTEKIWGVSCDKIPPDWGAQRIKNLSISKALFHILKNIFNLNQSTETSLIEHFFYPSYGAGQMYEEMANKIISHGGEIYLNQEVISIKAKNDKIVAIIVKDSNKILKEIKADYFISTMPVKNLINNLDYPVPSDIKDIANNLVYRDYIIIGLLFKKIIINNTTKITTKNNIIPDNWIYIQENNIKMGRLDIFNNFSQKMLCDNNKVWLGAEYFCDENDEFWEKNDMILKDFAVAELAQMKIIDPNDFLDYKVIKVPKAYPAYFGAYNRFDEIKSFVEKFENLYLIGRNGMHRYNNMDHSVLSGLMAADNIINGLTNKKNLWEINTEEKYHESK